MNRWVAKTARYHFLLLLVAPLLVLVAGIFSFEAVSNCDAAAKEAFLRPFYSSDSSGVVAFGQEIRARYTLMAMSLLMYCACVGVIGVSVYTIVQNVGRRMAQRLVSFTLAFAAVLLAVIFSLPFMESLCGGKLIYQFPREALATSELLLRLLGKASSAPSWPSVAGWINIAAIALGILGAKLAVVAVATTLIGENAGTGTTRHEQLAKQMRSQRRLLYCGTLVLTAAVLSMGAWLQWPASLLADAKTHAALLDWANGVTLFWGGVFTVYLFAAYVPAAGCLQARAHLLADRRPKKQKQLDSAKWLEARALTIRPTAQIPQVLAILAPLVAGSLNPAFIKAAGLG